MHTLFTITTWPIPLLDKLTHGRTRSLFDGRGNVGMSRHLRTFSLEG